MAIRIQGVFKLVDELCEDFFMFCGIVHRLIEQTKMKQDSLYNSHLSTYKSSQKMFIDASIGQPFQLAVKSIFMGKVGKIV